MEDACRGWRSDPDLQKPRHSRFRIRGRRVPLLCQANSEPPGCTGAGHANPGRHLAHTHRWWGGSADSRKGWLGDWTPTDKGIYFFNREAEPGPTIELFDFASEEVSHVAVLEHPPLNNWLSVSPDEKWILYVRSEQAESDIMLVENFR